jgi:cyclic dehypoxanthinyl futalosine synthase
MVYAVWAARHAFARDHGPELVAVEEELVQSMDYGREHLPEVVGSAAGHFRFGVDCLTRYFQVLHYDFPVDYQVGLRRFFELAHEAGELAEVPEFRFLDKVTAAAAGSPLGATRPSDGTGAPRTTPSGRSSAPRAAAAGPSALRMTDAEALSLLRSRDLLELGSRAHEMRLQKAPGNLATFIVDRNINYTNVCVSGCAFCAFHCAPGSADAYVLPRETILTKIQETIELGGTAVMLQGGLHPELDVTYFEALFRAIKERFDITIHSLSPPEIAYIAAVSGLSVRETLMRLRAAGLDSLPGGGAEILVDRVREQVAPGKASRDVWLGVMREAHLLGIPGTATMMFGSVETLVERVAHLRAIRDLQDETGGFRAFIPWTFQPGHTKLEGLTEKATGVDYLTTLAVSRLYLDNVANIQASWVTQGLEIGQVALRFGANDLGSTMIEENVVAATGLRVKVNRDDMVRAIRAAGFTPTQRRTDYSLVPLWESAS